MTTEEFFADQVKNPQAKNWPDYEPYIGFSVSADIYKRDEDAIKKLVKKYDLIQFKTGGIVSFRKRKTMLEAMIANTL